MPWGWIEFEPSSSALWSLFLGDSPSSLSTMTSFVLLRRSFLGTCCFASSGVMIVTLSLIMIRSGFYIGHLPWPWLLVPRSEVLSVTVVEVPIFSRHGESVENKGSSRSSSLVILFEGSFWIARSMKFISKGLTFSYWSWSRFSFAALFLARVSWRFIPINGLLSVARMCATTPRENMSLVDDCPDFPVWYMISGAMKPGVPHLT